MFQNAELNSSKIDLYSLIGQSPFSEILKYRAVSTLNLHDNAKFFWQLRSIMLEAFWANFCAYLTWAYN